MSKPKTLQDKVCPTCGHTFHPRTSAQIFCSVKCKKERPRSKDARTCPQCGNSFEVQFTSVKQIHCSVACRAEASKVDKSCVCEQCGVTFKRKHSKQTRFCSRSCANVARYAATREAKNVSN